MSNWWDDQERLKQWYQDKDKLSTTYYWSKYKGICYRDGCVMRLIGSSAGSFYECPKCGWAVMDNEHLITNKKKEEDAITKEPFGLFD